MRSGLSSTDGRRMQAHAGASLSQSQVQIWWQEQHFRKVKYGFHGRHVTFAKSGTDFVAGAALSQDQVQI